MDWSHYSAEDQTMLRYLKEHDMHQAAVDLMQVLDARVAADKGQEDYKSPEGSPRSSPVTVPDDDDDHSRDIPDEGEIIMTHSDTATSIPENKSPTNEDSDKDEADSPNDSDNHDEDSDNENLDAPFSMDDDELDASKTATTLAGVAATTSNSTEENRNTTDHEDFNERTESPTPDLAPASSTLSERSQRHTAAVLSKGKQATGVFFRKVKNTFKKVGSHRGVATAATTTNDQDASSEESHDHESSNSNNSTSDEHSASDAAGVTKSNNDRHESPPDEEKPDNGKDDDDVDDIESSVDMDDLDQMLESLDVDRDFQCWTSFRSSMVRRAEILEDDSSDDDDDDSHDNPHRGAKLQQGQTPDERFLEEEDIAQWKERLQREEVFSRRYRPNKDEQTELLDLEKFLNAGGGGDLVNMFNAFLTAATSAATASAAPNDSSAAVLQKLIRPDAKTPASILLKRGPVLFESSYDQDQTEHEAELILLTHGCIIGKVIPPEEQGDNFKSNVVARMFERAIEWKDVACVAPNEDEMYAWEMVFRGARGQERLSFVTGSERQQEAWLEAMEAVLINHFIQDSSMPKDLGWQYRICHKGAYTLAVTDVEDDLHFTSETLRHHDSYNGYSPLHVSMLLGYYSSFLDFPLLDQLLTFLLCT